MKTFAVIGKKKFTQIFHQKKIDLNQTSQSFPSKKKVSLQKQQAQRQKSKNEKKTEKKKRKEKEEEQQQQRTHHREKENLSKEKENTQEKKPEFVEAKQPSTNFWEGTHQAAAKRKYTNKRRIRSR